MFSDDCSTDHESRCQELAATDMGNTLHCCTIPSQANTISSTSRASSTDSQVLKGFLECGSLEGTPGGGGADEGRGEARTDRCKIRGFSQ